MSSTEIPVQAEAFRYCPYVVSSTAPVETHLDVVEKLLSNGFNHLQVKENYIVPLKERPQMDEVSHSYSIPVIDLKNLDGPARKSVVNEIKRACEEDGFFQIVNHGVPEALMKRMMDVAKEFFEMPPEDRACLYSDDPRQLVRLSTSFNITKDKFLNWMDYLTQPCHPLEEYIHAWPQKPAAYREIAGEYAKELRALALRLMAAISEAMGQDSDYLNRVFKKHRHLMNINYYPSCPNPDLTLGISPHSDPGGISVLMQGLVSGLQVHRDGKWVAVEPISNAFVVNLGDQLQVLSNGRFQSIEHRAITNNTTARISIPSFYGPSLDAFISPAESMVDEEHPALYRGYRFEEYMGVFWSQELRSKSILDGFKIETGQ
ncbi:protein DMR6-LIKE OXYGENASE 1 [Cryptomeria japonica]|uniref:protein DMR6-LIKE OXYGENASE 1 n=1 Tax=Cryptomeria japonica TaxID=3369 RepID=UPI0025AD1967|nr:protein DMR6-LIKE OXYGENASE 1 [Cryptomeria japonica]